jgi:hypothetical protein
MYVHGSAPDPCNEWLQVYDQWMRMQLGSRTKGGREVVSLGHLQDTALIWWLC